MIYQNLNISGPPGPPGGIWGEDTTASTIKVKWHKGDRHGRDIMGYIIEGYNEHEKIWRELKTSESS